MGKRLLYFKDENGKDIAIDTKKVTFVQPSSGRGVTYINFVGGPHATVQGTVDDIVHAIRIHSTKG